MFARLTSKTGTALGGFFARLKDDCSGNVLMIFGYAVIPLTFVAGFGVDYGRAMRLQTQLNAAADAAALAAVSPTMMFESNDASRTAATNMFNSQASLLEGYRNLEMTPTVTNATSGSGGTLGYLRKAKITYTAESVNFFGGVLGADTLEVSGSATASAAQPPNVDFYLAMDNSPSMLLPSTSDGILKVIAATKNEHNANGCAYACHAQLPHTDHIYIEDSAGRDVLLSTSYYTAGASRQGTWYRWDDDADRLYDSAGNAMNTSSTEVTGPTRVNGNKYPCPTKSNPSKTCSASVYIDTTTTTASSTTYTITDSTTGAVTITRSDTTDVDLTRVYRSTTNVNTVYHTAQINGNPSTNSTTFDYGYWADGFWLTHNYGQLFGSPSRLTLRKDAMVAAATQLIPFAADQAEEYRVTYQMQMFSFDWVRSGQTSPVRQLTNLTDVSTYSGSFSVESIFPADDYWYKNNMPTSSLNIGDKATETLKMLNFMNSNIPNAGNGAPGQTPQKILFIITDGMLDQDDGGRVMGPMRSAANKELAKCSAIKARGIKIAILYTQYLPESLVGDSWSQNNVAPWLPPAPSPFPAGNGGSSDQILTALQSCASPGNNGQPLVQTVTSDENISTALQTLFSTALQSARLIR